jgi:hypothetical protein
MVDKCREICGLEARKVLKFSPKLKISPVKFPVTREMQPETSLAKTGSTARLFLMLPFTSESQRKPPKCELFSQDVLTNRTSETAGGTLFPEMPLSQLRRED